MIQGVYRWLLLIALISGWSQNYLILFQVLHNFVDSVINTLYFISDPCFHLSAILSIFTSIFLFLCPSVFRCDSSSLLCCLSSCICLPMYCILLLFPVGTRATMIDHTIERLPMVNKGISCADSKSVARKPERYMEWRGDSGGQLLILSTLFLRC